MPVSSSIQFETLRQEVLAATRPQTALQRWFANEVARATWELEHARKFCTRNRREVR